MEEKAFESKFAAVLTGDKAAFTDIYNEIKTPVFTVIFRIVQNRAESEDIMQDLFLRLLKHGKDDTIKHPRRYIFVMARNLAFDALRKKQPESLDESMPDTSPLPEDSCDRADIEAALAHLTLSQRDTVTLHVTLGMKFREIAKMQKVPLGTVLYRYNSAIKKLQKLLSE